MKSEVFGRLLGFLNDLEERNLHYTLAHHRDEAVMVLVAVPGERWEIEFLSDGSVEVERFSSIGEIQGEEALAELFTRFSDQGDSVPEASQFAELTASTVV
jgi:hypothetical protein